MTTKTMDGDAFFRRVHSDIRELVNDYSTEGWPPEHTATALLMAASSTMAISHPCRASFKRQIKNAAKGLASSENIELAWKKECAARNADTDATHGTASLH